MGRTLGGSLAILLASAGIPLACGLATAGLESPEGTKLHDAAAPDSRPVAPDGHVAHEDAAMPPTTDGATPVDAPEDAFEDASDGSLGDDAAGPPCPTGVLFCDGFEQGLGAWPQTEKNDGTIGLDTTHVHRGAEAVGALENAITQQGGNPYVTIDHTQTWPPHFWVRFFVYVPSPFPPSNAALLNLIQQSGIYPGIQLYLAGGTGNVSMTTFLTGNDHDWRSATTSPLDQWVCFEVETDVPNGTVHVSMNATHLADLDQMGISLPSPNVTKLGLGFYNPNTQGPYEVWLDDVIVDSKAIGCAK